MRFLLAFCLLFLLARPAFSQQQESKLVDRLLRPNMELQSKEQNKHFTADKVGVNRKARVKDFYSDAKTQPKSFAMTRDFDSHTSKQNSWAFNAAGNDTTRVNGSRHADLSRTYATNMVRTPVQLRDADKSQPGRLYAGTRPYLEKGKSQKSLDHKNPPMSIDDIRELLNKNK